MSNLKMDRHAYYVSRRRAERREYWLIFCLLYPQLLVAEIVTRIVSLADRRRAVAAEPRRSVFVEAKVAADSWIPFIFK